MSRLKGTSVHLPEEVIHEIDALASRLPSLPGARFSRNGWIASAIRAALDAARTTPAAPSQTPNT